MTFSLDRDLLVFEPRLFAELAWPAQRIAAGDDGQLAGETFTSDSADFLAAGATPGQVLHVQTDAGPAAFEIISADAADTLTVSALREETDDDLIPPTLSGTGLSWHVVSFAAQASAVALEMLAHFGLSPADPASPWTADDIAHPEALRALSACGVLAAVLAGAASRTDANDGYWAKSAHYRRLFERGLGKVRVGLDADGDGADVVRNLGAPRLRRD